MNEELSRQSTERLNRERTVKGNTPDTHNEIVTRSEMRWKVGGKNRERTKAGKVG